MEKQENFVLHVIENRQVKLFSEWQDTRTMRQMVFFSYQPSVERCRDIARENHCNEWQIHELDENELVNAECIVHGQWCDFVPSAIDQYH